MALNFTLLTDKQIWGDGKGNEPLDVMKKYGTSVAPTDLAILLGCHMSDQDNRTSEGDLTCASWSASSNKDGLVRFVANDGHLYWHTPVLRGISTRPVLSPEQTVKIPSSTTTKSINDVDITLYGEYPQTVVDTQTNNKMEELFYSQALKTTGKIYSFDSVYANKETPFRRASYAEYEYNGQKYIRVKGRYSSSTTKLSSGEWVMDERPYWVRVEPIEWLKDPTGTWVSKKCLFAGIQFDTNRSYDGDFSKTFMKKYLDTYFAKEIETPEMVADREKLVKRQETIKGLKAKLAEAIDPDKVKATVGFTRTESRREIAEAIKTTRRARDVFVAAGKKAQKEGDQELIEQIVEMADFYVRSDQAQRGAARQRRAEYRAKRTAAKKDSGR